MFHPIDDPHEEIDPMNAELTYSWVVGLASQPLIELVQSAAPFRPVQPGQNLPGY